MSVPLGLREEGKFQILTKVNDLYRYTKQLCTNEKYFPKRIRWMITNDIVQLTTKIMDSIVYANSIYVVCKEDFKRRREYQQTAYETTYVLINRANLYYLENHIDEHKVKVWCDKMFEIQWMIKNWMSKDAKKYGQWL